MVLNASYEDVPYKINGYFSHNFRNWINKWKLREAYLAH